MADPIVTADFQCHLDHHLFTNWGDAKNPKWKGCNSKKPSKFIINAGAIDLDILKEKVKNECNNVKPKLGDMVVADWVPRVLKIEWYCWIKGQPDYLVNKEVVLKTSQDVIDWATTATRYPGKQAGISLKMEKPESAAEQAKAVSLASLYH